MRLRKNISIWACCKICYQKHAWCVSEKQLEKKKSPLNCFDLFPLFCSCFRPFSKKKTKKTNPKKRCCLGSTHAKLGLRLFPDSEMYCTWAASPTQTSEKGGGKSWPCISNALSSELWGKKNKGIGQTHFSFGTAIGWYAWWWKPRFCGQSWTGISHRSNLFYL